MAFRARRAVTTSDASVFGLFGQSSIKWPHVGHLPFTSGWLQRHRWAHDTASAPDRLSTAARHRGVRARLRGPPAHLHNLLGRHALHAVYIAVGLWGLGLGRVLVRTIPFARPAWLFAPAARRWTWFFPVTGYYLYIDYVGPLLVRLFGPALRDLADGPARFQEPMELLLACGFALFVLDALRRATR